MVSCGTRIYWRKQSLFHLPRLLMSQRGKPMLAAVVAAPMRNECVDMLELFGNISCNIRVKDCLVR